MSEDIIKVHTHIHTHTHTHTHVTLNASCDPALQNMHNPLNIHRVEGQVSYVIRALPGVQPPLLAYEWYL